MPTTRRSTRRDLGGSLQVQDMVQRHENGGAKAQLAQHRRRSTRNYRPSSTPKTTAAMTELQHEIAESATDPTTTRPERRNSARMKRPLELIHPNPDPTKVKRSRIAVEIKSLAKLEPPSPSRTIVVRPPPPSSTVDVTTQQNKPPPPPPPPPSSLPTPPSTNAAPAAEPATQPKTAQKEPTVHQKKVYNGIRHELDRLQPSLADAGLAKESGGGRKLRSQEATRFKSELSAYFPDYDEVIGNDAKESHVLNVDTPILVVDSVASPHHNVRASHPRQAAATTASVSSKQNHHAKLGADTTTGSALWVSRTENYHVKQYGDDLYSNLYDAQRIQLPGQKAKPDHLNDPLPDSLYETAHRRAERLEKTIRNTEKGRAQHERDQIVRLLGELQGPDWLRTMGVNGVTESKKKGFESARSHFIKGCEGILEKFRWWAQEERKRKLERDRALAEEQDDDEDDDEEEEEDPDEDQVADSDADEDGEMLDVDSANRDPADDSDGDPPDSSDVDAHIAKQLHEEALARVKRPPSVSNKRQKRDLSPSPVPQPPREFKSFFDKRHDRDAALSKVRRSRRVALAWGHAIPETIDEDFELQPEYRDEETMQTRERRKRRDRRSNHR
ncbi:hypothetical protein PFICI_06948 [Pestalotiopsis fici W106-1]|uniref:Something about silencing protein 4 domain-containing protein n=1 Tax=Pestalotiopsis fici (strain W106-1 / CGMCC3.15140) TaxID=1229662 RepID=W3X9U7_PESFW|nr:uncharacterized protein PFICI_06948 [Pestalotiopsis fici W106-1]ETS81946.1 hypothetical protein PFICI_06948 [Pestalotiopsis fici W106-1]